MNLKIRCSQLHNIMALPKALKDRGSLSKGAQTYVAQLAKEHVYQYRSEHSSKYTEKGHAVEGDSIELLNDLMLKKGEFIFYEKNTVRYENDFLTGEMDIVSQFEEAIRDTKSSWSLDTFPANSIRALEQSNAKDYEWQGRGYMLLLNHHGIPIKRHFVDYCLSNTPDHLISSYDTGIHNFDHYPIEMRVTSVVYERDLDLEKLIKERCLLAQEFFALEVQRILEENGLSKNYLNEIEVA